MSSLKIEKKPTQAKLQWRKDFPEIEEIPMDVPGCLARMLEDKKPALDRLGRKPAKPQMTACGLERGTKIPKSCQAAHSQSEHSAMDSTGVQVSTSRSTHHRGQGERAGELRERWARVWRVQSLPKHKTAEHWRWREGKRAEAPGTLNK